MRGLKIPSPTALLLGSALPFVGAAAMAATCASSDPCSIDLGHATANFAAGSTSYFAEVVLLQGTDASFSPGPQALPTLQVSQAAASEGFSLQPQVYAYVGGSGIQGLHEVEAKLLFSGLSFTADTGYQVNGVQAVIKGSFSLVGDAYGWPNVPGALQWTGQTYSATLALDPTSADFYIGFNVAASYLQGDDGTALSYGAGSASFDNIEFIVDVSALPVPEPAPAALLAAGLAVLGCLARYRSRS